MDNLLGALQKIKLFVFDVDGVLTNSQILLSESGEQLRSMNIKDGYALQLAIKKGFQIVIISGATADPVVVRMNKLGVSEVFMGIKNKAALLKRILIEKGLSAHEIMVMGDDVPDLEILKMAGVAACPQDAVHQVKKVCHFISAKNGGEGCVREIIEKIMTLQHLWNEDLGVASI